MHVHALTSLWGYAGARAAYKLACDFVAATNLTYGWTSQRLSELGGSEKARLPDLFAADYEWSQKVRVTHHCQAVSSWHP